MKNINFEIKARTSEKHQNFIKKMLREMNIQSIGTDNQIDTYFKINEGRMKIRKGDIENALVYYSREDKKDSKQSEVEIYPLIGNSRLEKTIRDTHDVLITVAKKREIYFISNVKIHLDEIAELGKFIEIEAISQNGKVPTEVIKSQCNYYKKLFKIEDKDLIKDSYSDMLLCRKN